jgi:vacuolar-type H+-ATPase subunit I/STV1
VQGLQDESKIRAEKIGSGNWYWAFVSDDKIARQKALDVAQSDYDKALATDNELKSKLAEAEAQRREDDEMLNEGGETREELLSMKKSLEAETEALRRELATYSDNDPTELEQKVKDAAAWKVATEEFTDDIYSMEGWLKDQMGGGEALDAMLQETYDKEYDEENRGLKELV